MEHHFRISYVYWNKKTMNKISSQLGSYFCFDNDRCKSWSSNIIKTGLRIWPWNQLKHAYVCVYIYVYLYTHSLIKNNNKRTCPKPGILMQTPTHTIEIGDMNHQHLASGFAGNAQKGMAQAALLQLFYSRGMGWVQKGKPSGLIPSNLVIYSLMVSATDYCNL